jgi:tetratricopeptide (TPR) repeat protein
MRPQAKMSRHSIFLNTSPGSLPIMHSLILISATSYCGKTGILKAAKCYEKAIEVEKTFTDAYHNLAWILHEIKAYEAALEFTEKGLSEDPDHEDLQKLAARIRNQIG